MYTVPRIYQWDTEGNTFPIRYYRIKTFLLSMSTMNIECAVINFRQTLEKWCNWAHICVSAIYVVIWGLRRERWSLYLMSLLTVTLTPTRTVTEIWTILLWRWCYSTRRWYLEVVCVTTAHSKGCLCTWVYLSPFLHERSWTLFYSLLPAWHSGHCWIPNDTWKW